MATTPAPLALAGTLVISRLTRNPAPLEPPHDAPARRFLAQLSPSSVWMPVRVGSHIGG